MIRSCLAFLGFLGLAIALTWPLATNLGGLVLPDAGDPLLNTWILWWNATNLPLSPEWWNAPAFFPAEGVITFSEHLLGLWPIASPILWITGNSQIAYNITLLLTFALSATAGWWLGLELTGRRDAALLCGLAFGFAPYRIAQLSHLQVLASFWMPVALVGLHRYLRDGGARPLLLFAGAWLMQALSNVYFMVFFPVLVVLWCAWFLTWRHWRRIVMVGLAAAVAALPLVPILLRYREVHSSYGLTRDLETTAALSADAAAWLNAKPWLAMWRGLRVFNRPEGELFTGLTVIGLILAGWWSVRFHAGSPPASMDRLRSSLAFYSLAAIAMCVLALGPSPTLMGESLSIPGPYRALMWVPGVDALRVPARFAMLTALCLAAAAAAGYAVLSATWPRALRWIVAGVAAGGLVAETWPSRIPMEAPPAPLDIRGAEVPGALLVLPMLRHWNEVAIMYQSMSHGRPVVNGYSGYEAPWTGALRARLEAFDPFALEALAEAGVTQIAVIARHDRGGDWRAYVLTRARHARTTADGAVWLYDLPKPTAASAPPLPIRSIQVSEHPALVASMTDGDPATFWHSRQPQTGGESVAIDLGRVHRVDGIDVSLGRFIDAFPRQLTVETSIDGAGWQEAWRGDAGRLVILPIFEPATDVRLRFPVGGKPARYLRLTQTGRADQSSWTIAELIVRGNPDPVVPGR
jgi:hypothetical protein